MIYPIIITSSGKLKIYHPPLILQIFLDLEKFKRSILDIHI